MPTLTDEQLAGLASPNLGAGVELDQDWQDPYPDAPCWGWALFGGPGGNANNTPPVIFEHALLLNEGGNVIGVKPNFVQWVQATFNNQDATDQAQIIEDHFADAFLEPNDQTIVVTAFAKLCVILAGLTPSDDPTNYSVVMASDRWYSWEHWSLGLANDIDAPQNPALQYVQRDAGVNPVNTRCRAVWANHPILTSICIEELHQGHIDYLEHAVGWPDDA
ncbi:MAG: hypothetical protein E6Q88_11885 [Lysobacteraceae bacterium]|nr:MAG: hypothetical protein E6Q88_11885 [Xanthomonadaceae bacterium]